MQNLISAVSIVHSQNKPFASIFLNKHVIFDDA